MYVTAQPNAPFVKYDATPVPAPEEGAPAAAADGDVDEEELSAATVATAAAATASRHPGSQAAKKPSTASWAACASTS
ncbi:unnamed protein product [Tilletia laevis]|nr:unnamed protein product [Tilletia laevis]